MQTEVPTLKSTPFPATSSRRTRARRVRATGWAALFAAALGVSASTVHADINTFPLWDGFNSIGDWGVPDTATYGQTFTPTFGSLSGFTVTVKNTSGLAPAYQAFVYAWDNVNNRITGPALFTSQPLVAPTNGAFTSISISTGSVPLTGGKTYVVFLTTLSQANAFNGLYNWGLLTTDDPIPNGQFVFSNNNTNFGMLSTDPWSTDFADDLAIDLRGVFLSNNNIVQVFQGESLTGTGVLPGSLYNAGNVQPGDAPGKIQVTGNYVQAPSGTLTIQLAGTKPGQFGQLVVDGGAILGGALDIESYNGFTPQRGNRFKIITAGGGVVGQFAVVSDAFATDTILNPEIIYGKNSVTIEVPTFAEFARNAELSPNELSVAKGLDSLGTDSRDSKLLTYLDNRPLQKLPSDFDRISPAALTSIFTMGVALAQEQSLNLQRRTDDIRSGSSGFSAANLAINGNNPFYGGGFGISTGVAGPSGYDGKELKETKEVKPGEDRWGAFLSGTGEWVSVGNTDNARGYDLASGGFTLGVDYKVCPNFAVGIAAGYTGTTSDFESHGRIWENGGKLGVYATTFVGGWYADAAAFGGYNSYSTRRDGLQGETRGDTDGGEINALLGTGYDFKAGPVTFGPTASFNYTYLGMNGFNENGSLAPLDIHGSGVESYRSAFGFKASGEWKVGGVLIKPEVRAAWQHEYGTTAYRLDSSFADGGAAFPVNGPRIGRDSALLGAGFALELNPRCSVYAYYDGELGRTNYQSSAVTGGVRLSF